MAKRHGLQRKSVRVIEQSGVEALSKRVVAEHVARVQAASARFYIKDSKFIFNMDQSDASFEKMVGRSLRKRYAPKERVLVQTGIRTKGKLDRVTVMPVVSAAGVAYTPVIVFPGIQAHYRRVRGKSQTLEDVLPPYHLFQREIPGVNSEINFEWAQTFVDETAKLRANNQHPLLVIDGYGSHVQFRTLKLFKESNVVFIALPSHTSDVL